MKIIKSNSILFVLVILSASCSLLDPATDLNSQQQSSNEIIINSIEFDIQKTSTTSEWTYCAIEKVDLSMFSNIDSIIFTPNMRSQLSDEKCIVELYDFNENAVISESHVESTVRYTLHYGRSNNMIQTFPHTPTLIGFRFRSSKNDHFIEVGVGSRILIYSH